MLIAQCWESSITQISTYCPQISQVLLLGYTCWSVDQLMFAIDHFARMQFTCYQSHTTNAELGSGTLSDAVHITHIPAVPATIFTC